MDAFAHILYMIWKKETCFIALSCEICIINIFIISTRCLISLWIYEIIWYYHAIRLETSFTSSSVPKITFWISLNHLCSFRYYCCIKWHFEGFVSKVKNQRIYDSRIRVCWLAYWCWWYPPARACGLSIFNHSRVN